MLKTSGFSISRWSLVLFSGDLLFFAMSIPVGYWLGLQIGGQVLFLREEVFALIALSLVYFTVLYIGELYNFYLDFRQRENVGQLILWGLAAALVALGVFGFPTRKILPRRFLEWQAVIFIWLLVFWRYGFSALALPTRLKRRLIIVGAGQAGRTLLEAIQRRPQAGFEPVGFVDDDPAKADSLILGLPVLGDSSRLENVVKEHNVNLVIMAITHEKRPELINTITRLSYNSVQVMDMPALFEALTGKVPTDHISDAWLLFHSLNTSKIYYRHFKRLFDLIISLGGLALLWPVFLIIAAAIKMDSPGPVLFRQKRLGLGGKPFIIFKFRTMVATSEEEPPRWAALKDPRITRVGRFLRWFRLDELPQLINIVKGEMSLIGPRAEWDVFANESLKKVVKYRTGRRATDPPGTMIPCGYQECIPFYSFRNIIRPGITGWAQVMFPLAGSSPEDLKEKQEYDLYYIKNMSFLLDLVILLKTVRIVILGKGK
jgi:exopolysaccharide biosynthesis polyprenyl glycosylphosphotransferase